MSREIIPIPSSISGNDITVPFPDLAKPEEGGWELNVTLRNDSGGGRAKITLFQSTPDDGEKEL